MLTTKLILPEFKNYMSYFKFFSEAHAERGGVVV
jgi:hypothetical protein